MPGDSKSKHKGLISPWVRRFRWFTGILTAALVGGAVYSQNPIATKDKTAPSRSAPVAKRWSRFAWPEVGVEVIMPEGPQRQRLGNLPADPLRQRVTYASTADAMTYFITCTDYSRDVSLSASDDELTANATQWLGAGAAGNKGTVERISLAGHEGVEVDRVVQNSDGRRVCNRTRWFFLARRGIVVGATGTKDQFDEVGATRFLESLQFSEAKK